MARLPAKIRYDLRKQDTIRRGFEQMVNAGLLNCVRCGERIRAGEPWDVGHVDGSERTVVSGPEHRRCNRATESHKRTPHSRPW